MTTLAEYIIVAGAENRPPMLEKSMYDSWESHIRLFIKGKKHGRMMLDSIDNDDCDVQATNIILHGLPPDMYALVNHQEASTDILDKVKLLMKGTKLSYQERKCRLYNLFDKFASVQGETLYEYYWRFSQLINDMHTIGMTMQQVQVNTKFLNALPPEWSKFVTDVKLAKNFVMSDSEDSTVTYTKVSSPFEDLSNLGSPGVDGLPMMPEDPYAYVKATMQEPPSPEFVLEPVYPKFLPPEDEEDEEDPEEDLKEDTADYPADRGDDDDYDDESSDDDKEDVNDVDEDEDEEEEEHLALVDSVPSPIYRTTATMSIRPQTMVPFPFEAEVDRLLAISIQPPSPLTSYSSPLPQIPSLPLPVSSPLPISPSQLPTSLTHLLGYRAEMIRLRAESTSTSHPLPLTSPMTTPSGIPPLLPIPLPTSSPPLLLPSTDCRVDVLEVTLPPQKSYVLLPVPNLRFGSVHLLLLLDLLEDTDEIYGRLDDAQDDRSVRTTILAHQTKIGDLRAVDCRRQTQLTEALTLPKTLQTQMAALQSQQTPARDPAHPDVPEEADSSS
ncbi:hypothetical protein Tco_0927318 [Tanacetum coccineum]